MHNVSQRQNLLLILYSWSRVVLDRFALAVGSKIWKSVYITIRYALATRTNFLVWTKNSDTPNDTDDTSDFFVRGSDGRLFVHTQKNLVRGNRKE